MGNYEVNRRIVHSLWSESNLSADIPLVSTGFEFRPRLNNNAIFLGFRQVYNKQNAKVPALPDGFVEMVFTY